MVAVAVLVGIAATACGGLRYQYAGSASLNNVFRVPDGWKLYTKTDLLKTAGIESDPAAVSRYKLLIGFDADTDPSALAVLDLSKSTSRPVVLAWVRQLGETNRDGFSLGSIRNALFPIDSHVNNDSGDLVSYNGRLVLGDGFHGSKATYVITGPNADNSSHPEAVEVSQAGALDPATNLFYFLSVRCSPTCFTQYRTTIQQILNSWTIKEH